MPNGPISASGLNRNPQNIYIYSSGYDSTPSLISNHFSIFEMASTKMKKIRPLSNRHILNGNYGKAQVLSPTGNLQCGTGQSLQLHKRIFGNLAPFDCSMNSTAFLI